MTTQATIDLSAKQVFTTGEAADLCRISQQTIIRCFDSGRLRGFRVPGSRFRRIPRDELLRFMRENSIPTEALEGARRRVLIVDEDDDTVVLLADALRRDGRFEVRTAAGAYDAGLMTLQFKPDLLVLAIHLADMNPVEVCRSVRNNPELSGMRIVVTASEATPAELDRLMNAGADEFVRKPFVFDRLIARMAAMLIV